MKTILFLALGLCLTTSCKKDPSYTCRCYIDVKGGNQYDRFVEHEFGKIDAVEAKNKCFDLQSEDDVFVKTCALLEVE